MAPRQEDPTASVGPAPTLTPPATSVASPIGVPFYETDPTTGQPLIGPDGQPVRWSAHPQVPNDVNAIDERGALVHAGGMHQNIPPRYFDGSQWLPGSLPPDQMATLQKAMIAAGIAKPGELQLGVWDVSSMNAYSKVLAYANSAGVDASTALSRWGYAHTANPDAGTPRAPLVVKVTNPDDLRRVMRKAVIDELGQGWASSDIDKMVAAYQGVETEAQQQQYAMTGSGSSTDPGQGGTITAPPDPTTYAATQARAANPNLAQEHDTLGFVDQFQNLVGKWAG